MIHLFYLLKELMALPREPGDDRRHLQCVMQWLKTAYKNGQGGVSSHYSLLKGKWLNPFPETTGYIIPTFFDYYDYGKDKYFFSAAVRMTDWLSEVQLDNGACMQGAYDRAKGKNKPIIFNTGQNIFGFLRTYQETGEKKYLDCAVKAGDFLISSVDKQGIWDRFLHNDLPHTYNSRTAWALLKLHAVTGGDDYRKIAIANLDWVVARQQTNGWFENANFKPHELPNTHGIAYTLRGLLESCFITGEKAYLDAVSLASANLLKKVEAGRPLYTFWDRDWQNHGKYFPRLKGRYICLTGNVQLAMVWLKLFKATDDDRYLNAANRLIDRVKSLHNISSRVPGIKGGVKGAFPVSGSYSFLKYPNWAAKFFADALMVRIASGGQEPF
jgi:rhamnogalacturonyl hydrolase YesR